MLALLALAASTAAPAAWRRATSPRFTVYSEAPEGTVRAYAADLERYDAVMRDVTGIGAETPAAPVTVFFVDNPAAVRKLLADGSRSAAGFYNGRASGPMAVVPRLAGTGPNALNANTILFHEYAHHFMMQHYAVAFPAWYVEGFAEFYSTVTFGRDGSAMVGRAANHRAFALVRGTRLPIDTLLTAQRRDLKPDQQASLYARGWLLTHYLTFESSRKGQLRDYLLAINAGTAPQAAATRTFGDLAKLDREINRYMLQTRLPAAPIPAASLPTPTIVVETLDATESAIVPEKMLFMRGVRQQDKAAFVADVRRIAATAPANLAVLSLRAQAEAMAGDYAASDTAADAVLARSPKDARMLLRKGLNLRDRLGADPSAEQVAAARKWIVKANRADPDDPLPLIHYYQSFERSPAARPSIATDGLVRASNLVPQDMQLRVMAAAALANRKRFDEAAAIIAPAAYAPHETAATIRARALLDRISAARKGTASPGFNDDGKDPDENED